jgi:hypothetical protein
MHGHSRRRLLLSAVAMVGVLMAVGQMSAFAQSANPAGQAATPEASRSFLFFGGAYQVIEQASGNCAGQCNLINEWTGGCTCPNGYVPLPSARMLITVGSGNNIDTCGSLLFICAR